MANLPLNTFRPRIAVAGASGRVGKALITGLQNDPVEIVALTRDPQSGKLPPSVARTVVDFERSSSLSDALRGSNRLFIAHGTSLQQVRNEIALIDAAVTAGVAHIVKLSAMGPATRLHPFDWHMEIEAHLAKAEVGYTILRPTTFMDTLARAGAAVAADDWGGTAGDGQVNLIDTRDVAEIARLALLDDRCIGSQRAYHLTGPGSVSMPDVAVLLSRLLGRSVTYEHRTPTQQRAALIRAGTSEAVADLLLGLELMFEQSVLAETTQTFSDLTGRKPRSVERWLCDNLVAFAIKRGPDAA